MNDAGTNPTNGVVCWIEFSPDGQLRLAMDDVVSSNVDAPRFWRKSAPFTSREFDKQAFLECNLSENDLADIGLNLVSRLAAAIQAGQRNRNVPPDGQR